MSLGRPTEGATQDPRQLFQILTGLYDELKKREKEFSNLLQLFQAIVGDVTTINLAIGSAAQPTRPPGFDLVSGDFDDIGGGIVVPGPPGTGGPIGLPGAPGQDGEPGDDGMPGRPGDRGLPGIQGAPGFGADGEDGADGLPGSPGVPGVAGIAGAVGAMGPPMFMSDGEDGDAGMAIPGQAGATGATGTAGVSNVPGPMGDAGEDGNDGGARMDFSGLPLGALPGEFETAGDVLRGPQGDTRIRGGDNIYYYSRTVAGPYNVNFGTLTIEDNAILMVL